MFFALWSVTCVVMSAEHELQPTAANHRPNEGPGVARGARADVDGAETGNGPACSKRRRTARRDRGGPPIDDPLATHQGIAARERLWAKYEPGSDGAFVWLGPGDDSHSVDQEKG